MQRHLVIIFPTILDAIFQIESFIFPIGKCEIKLEKTFKSLKDIYLLDDSHTTRGFFNGATVAQREIYAIEYSFLLFHSTLFNVIHSGDGRCLMT